MFLWFLGAEPCRIKATYTKHISKPKCAKLDKKCKSICKKSNQIHRKSTKSIVEHPPPLPTCPRPPLPPACGKRWWVLHPGFFFGLALDLGGFLVHGSALMSILSTRHSQKTNPSEPVSFSSFVFLLRIYASPPLHQIFFTFINFWNG